MHIYISYTLFLFCSQYWVIPSLNDIIMAAFFSFFLFSTLCCAYMLMHKCEKIFEYSTSVFARACCSQLPKDYKICFSHCQGKSFTVDQDSWQFMGCHFYYCCLTFLLAFSAILFKFCEYPFEYLRADKRMHLLFPNHNSNKLWTLLTVSQVDYICTVA